MIPFFVLLTFRTAAIDAVRNCFIYYRKKTKVQAERKVKIFLETRLSF